MFRQIPHQAFNVGEKITLSVRYMGIPCGEVVLSVSELSTYRGRPVYVTSAHLYTNKAFSLIYEISDTLTSYVDAEGLFTWRMVKEIHEKKFKEPRQDTLEIYEYDQGRRLWSKNGEMRGEILPFTQDFISAIYYLRGIEWQPEADTIYAPLNDWKRNYQMSFELGKAQPMAFLSKRLPARMGRPHIELDGKYRIIGSVGIWFTDDLRRIPMLIKCNIKLGNLYAKLVDYDPGRKPLAANERQAR
ncbi:MAG: hypothetical protein A3G34_15505 [Candidatus Lindowbacteria bacterium RIFCSPLOWO2_12_FULL_62_27]|nr:MAG: hypothetical protein A3I06_02005 [Candidatus Lindowbacteria bacterium RIFCSPLOWO2_02_FULL_62_12]OGH63257.1 MAG: hypothetical protein A3G34_15505 [Candidatus Lindowbacteria bacterium RIFCSPLOWO2_12_FULL_62_27]